MDQLDTRNSRFLRSYKGNHEFLEVVKDSFGRLKSNRSRNFKLQHEDDFRVATLIGRI